jgi:hypothetical protein
MKSQASQILITDVNLLKYALNDAGKRTCIQVGAM